MIGVFDSGFGGLSILKEIRKALPEYDYLYLGDSARAPYGTRSREEVHAYTLEAVEYLMRERCELIIIDCNTASAEAVGRIQQEYLPQHYPDRRVLGVIVIGGLLAAGYNNLVNRSQQVDSQWAQVQNVYQRRADLIPNLVNTVSGAANFEKSTLTQITEARASVGRVQSQINPNQAPGNAADLEKYQAAQAQLSSALSRLLVVVERYPDLKANSNFLNLQAQLEGTENRITTARNHFNDAAQSYNTTVQSFPTNMIAGHYGFTIRPYFQAKEGSDVPPAVHFDFNGSPTNAAPAH